MQASRNAGNSRRSPVRRRGISKRFTTRNALQEPVTLGIELVRGPFRYLSGGWRFEQLGDAGSKVSLELEFEFASRATDIIFGRFFENTCNSLVDAFTARASQMYSGSETKLP